MDKIYPPVNYHDYLRLDHLLNCQKTKSEEYGQPAHDEMLFVIIHQAYELWFKQILHELDSILELFKAAPVDEKNMGIIVARLDRIKQIQSLLVDQISVLETMTPLDFLDFRNYLIPASGFQSFQFRLIEIKLGLLPEQRIEFNQVSYQVRFPKVQQHRLRQAEQETSLFDLIEKWLERMPFLKFSDFNFSKVYQETIQRLLQTEQHIVSTNPLLSPAEKDRELSMLNNTRVTFETIFDAEKHQNLVHMKSWRLSYTATLAALFIHLYRDQPILQLPFRLLENLVDIDENFAIWRYRHALMVLRMIGRKIGTGGSSGHDYLRETTERYKIFSDLFNLSTFLVPRSELPELPPELVHNLNFHYH